MSSLVRGGVVDEHRPVTLHACFGVVFSVAMSRFDVKKGESGTAKWRLPLQTPNEAMKL